MQLLLIAAMLSMVRKTLLVILGDYRRFQTLHMEKIMQLISGVIRNSFRSLWIMLSAFVFVTSLQAQNIGWEGETGVFVTPLAYTAKSPKQGLGRPLVAYHYMNGGGVLGDFYNVSATVGAFSHVEFGYTRALHTLGGNPGFSPLWNNNSTLFMARLILFPKTLQRLVGFPQCLLELLPGAKFATSAALS
jgi:hypothetical protein